jgi:pteridine reductase
MPDLSGKVALITGAGHRVGRGIAVALGAANATIAVHYHGSRGGAESVVAELAAAGASAAAFHADLSRPESAAALASSVADHFGRIDVLVNSAAVMEVTTIDSVSIADWDRIMSINLRAPFFLAKEVARVMERNAGDEGGVIVNISDMAAFETWPDYIVHGISKAGITAMTRSLARVMAPRIRVNSVAPGAVLMPEGWPEESTRKVIASTPLHRIGSPEDVAAAVLYLVSAGYVTGETLIVDGGRHVRH